MNLYDVGDQTRISSAFVNLAGAAIDPTTVIFKFRSPSAVVTTSYVYGVDGAVIKDSVGNYHVDLALTEAGYWSYRWESTGVGQAAGEQRLLVRPASI